MPDYRIYKLNALGHVTGHARALICEKDADVVRKVESLIDGHDVEILEGARLVGRLKSVASYPTNQGRLPMPSSSRVAAGLICPLRSSAGSVFLKRRHLAFGHVHR